MSAQTVAQHAVPRPAAPAEAAASERPGWFRRLAAWLAVDTSAAEDESYEGGAGFPAPEPTTILPGVGRVGAVHGPARAKTAAPESPVERMQMPQAEPHAPGNPLFQGEPPQAPHPPFAPKPAPHAHVAIRMQRILVEASWDPELTPEKLWNALSAPVNELCALVEQEHDQARRMERNQRTAAAQAALLEDAVLRGEGKKAAAEAVAAMAGRAVHVGAEESTGLLPRITEGAPEPVEAAPAPAKEVEPDHEWTSEELSELGQFDEDFPPITSAHQLEQFGLDAEVRDNEGDVWVRFPTGWFYRCNGAFSRDPRSSSWLLRFAPLQVVSVPELAEAGTQAA